MFLISPVYHHYPALLHRIVHWSWLIWLVDLLISHVSKAVDKTFWTDCWRFSWRFPCTLVLKSFHSLPLTRLISRNFSTPSSGSHWWRNIGKCCRLSQPSWLSIAHCNNSRTYILTQLAYEYSNVWTMQIFGQKLWYNLNICYCVVSRDTEISRSLSSLWVVYCHR